jgi:RHS repeat-associated protein
MKLGLRTRFAQERFRQVWYFTAMLLVTLSPFCAVRTLAQDPPDFAMGTNPNSTYHGSDIDVVDMATGRLNLHIPLLVDHSQRGNLNFTYSLYFSSSSYYYVCTSEWDTYCFWKRAAPYRIAAGWPGLIFGADGVLSLGSQSYYDPDSGYTYNDDEALEANGAVHHLGTTATDQNGNPTMWESVDGTGIQLSGVGLASKDGILSTGQTVNNGLSSWTIEDPNGNEMGFSEPSSGSGPLTMTDTLGRTWTTTYNSTNVANCPVSASYVTLFDTPGPNSTTRVFKLCYSAVTIATTLPQCGSGTCIQGGGTVYMITGVVLPDLTTWKFVYDNYGDITEVFLPTGGTITYTYAQPWSLWFTDIVIRVVTSRTLYDGTTSRTWNYAYASYSVTVTDPLGNDSVYVPDTDSSGLDGAVQQVQYYSGTGSGRTLVKTVTNTFQYLDDQFAQDFGNGGTIPIHQSATTTWANGETSKVTDTYDAGFTYNDTNEGDIQYGPDTSNSIYGFVTSESKTDYGTGGNPGAVLSTTSTAYEYTSDSRYLTANILNLPSSVIITNGSGNKCSETDYAYDGAGGLGGLVTYPGTLTQHTAAPFSVLGNLTSMALQYSVTPCKSGATWTPLQATQFFVYNTGMRASVTDPLNNITTYSYVPPPPPAPQCAATTYYGAYVVQTAYPMSHSPNLANHVVSGCYDFNSGLLTQFTDQNSNSTSYAYDVMLRPTNVTYPSPDGGQTNFYYANTTTVEMQKLIAGTTWTDSFTYYDGLGRESRSMSKNDETLPWNQLDTCYDANGRVGFKSYAYQGNGTSTTKVCSGAGDAFLYDPLNRTAQVTHSDSSTVLTSYQGRATSVQDEGNGTTRVQEISQVDGLGRVASVCEVSGTTVLGAGGTPGACGQDIAGTGFTTTYTYDALNNLTSVSQAGYLPRSFTYDSLSRLLCSDNPEVQIVSCWQSPTIPFDTGSYTAGTIRYGYDANSNLTSKTAPKPSQTSTSVSVVATMTYDPLNRLRTKTYANSDNSTTFLAPSFTLNYDETTALGVTLSNTGGRSSSSIVAGAQASKIFSYDKLGRVKINSQCTPQNCGGSSPTVFPINYTYDLLGDTLTASNGEGVTLTYQPYNRALRITGLNSSLSDSNHPGTLFSSPHYNAVGSLLTACIGNTSSCVTENRAYDGRLRLCSISDGSIYSVSIYSATINNCPQGSTNGYAPDSDILQAVDSANTTWSYSYDEMNRLCNANHSSTAPGCHSSATITYGYDRFGNMWQGDGGLSITFNGNNNHIDWLSTHYDAAGNLLYDGATTYTYDSENRVISAANGSGTSTYLYDADGRRIRKTTPMGGTVDFLYDLGAHEITQITSAGSWTRGEVYAGGRHLATYSGGTGGTTEFNFSDWLGTERARSMAGATTACETITSLPFGDALTTTGSCGDASPMHFTGKQRDSETGLDNFGARYDSSQYGRFMTPDWSSVPTQIPFADISYPQSLNMYSYARNNPLARPDVDGHQTVCDPDTYSKDKDGNIVVHAGACHEVVDPVQMHQQSIWQTLMAIGHAGVLGVAKTYQTYTKPNPNTGKTYSGRTSGTKAPEKNVAARDRNHHMNEEGYGPAELDKSSSNPDAIRGREDQLIDYYGGPQSQSGSSGNAISGVSSSNPNAQAYENAANTEFGPVDGPIDGPVGGLMGPEGMTIPEEIPFDIFIW